MSLFSDVAKYLSDDFEERHGGFGPINLTWRKSDEWDRSHANRRELQATEANMDQIWLALDCFDAGDYPAALQIWRISAAQGSIWSMIEIGRCYEFGFGVTADAVEAERWYYRAFAGGSQIAMLKCAKAAASRGDFASCEEVLREGIEQDWTPAIFWSAWFKHKQSDSCDTYCAIFSLLQEAARRGHPAARMVFANFMMRGKFGWWRIPMGFYLVCQFAFKEVRA